MASRYSIKCMECGKAEEFGDTKDITFAKWRIFAWNVGSGEPICLCPKCEYKNPAKDEKAKRTKDKAKED